MKQINNLWCVVFVSSTIKSLTREIAEQGLMESRRIRGQKGITGITMLDHGNLLILLEGEKEAVLHEFEEVKKHPAHHSIIKLYNGSIPCLFFEGFSCAFKVSGNPELKNLDDFRSSEMKEYFELFLDTDHVVPRIVKDFAQKHAL